ncbi:hypothetical protein IP90_02704 [Luteimonas cucumeris]|uniref:DUF2065 domain-containing protein n=1 Tax=Luteimonas cucumeris TaxID=985012 RepID=A0A562L0C4_9GAMM|nr:DUF2065 family protein [Luteimonas cucumeris]TWI01082.1 hypothetical protein IP90_02704 [Luteimonas cucumeris]
MSELWAALCLVAVLEGLWLFAAPGAWKRAMAQMQALPEQHLRRIGGMILAAGLVMLYLVRG